MQLGAPKSQDISKILPNIQTQYEKLPQKNEPWGTGEVLSPTDWGEHHSGHYLVCWNQTLRPHSWSWGTPSRPWRLACSPRKIGSVCGTALRTWWLDTTCRWSNSVGSFYSWIQSWHNLWQRGSARPRNTTPCWMSVKFDTETITCHSLQKDGEDLRLDVLTAAIPCKLSRGETPARLWMEKWCTVPLILEFWGTEAKKEGIPGTKGPIKVERSLDKIIMIVINQLTELASHKIKYVYRDPKPCNNFCWNL